MVVFYYFACAGVAQSVEQRTENPCVDGSIPPPGTNLALVFSAFTHHTISVNNYRSFLNHPFFTRFKILSSLTSLSRS